MSKNGHIVDNAEADDIEDIMIDGESRWYETRHHVGKLQARRTIEELRNTNDKELYDDLCDTD